MEFFKTIFFADDSVNRFQQNVKNTLDPITKTPIIDGILITGIVLTTTATNVPHKLGRQPLMWIIADQNTTTTVKRTAWDATTITLISGATCTVNLWVA